MNETERKTYLEQFNRRTHVLGRIVSAITLVLLVGAPFLIGTFLGAMPDLGAVAKGFLSVGLVWTVSSVAEFLIYTPMLGAGGGYLAFITGNLINMKIPCAVNARIPRVYYGARDEAMGACGGVLNLFMERFPFRPALVGGILKDECRAVLADFFRTLRS